VYVFLRLLISTLSLLFILRLWSFTATNTKTGTRLNCKHICEVPNSRTANALNFIEALASSPRLRIVCELGVDNEWNLSPWLSASPLTSIYRFTDAEHSTFPPDQFSSRVHTFLDSQAQKILHNLRYIFRCDAISLSDVTALGTDYETVMMALRNFSTVETRVVSFGMCKTLHNCNDPAMKRRREVWEDLIQRDVRIQIIFINQI